MALAAEAVPQAVAGRLVQSFHDDGTVVDLDVAGRADGGRLLAVLSDDGDEAA
ncbi:hypothetical protein [Streptomyces sp. NPDC017890]|uniref:hypothetical protein n=1 Tax=Streptomyces sp. NPDC017890 TaxID=3365015 RepID=UPI0037931C3D